ncbi:DUF5417 domain-containing protein [Salmonella enterica]|nr:DUF5417 domain-containing protein [Salmonella enterica]
MKLTRQKTSDMGTTDIFGQAVRSGHWGQKHYFIIENAGPVELEAIEDMLKAAGWESDGCPCYEDGFTSGFHIDIDEVDAFKEAYKEAKKGLKAYMAAKAEPVVTPLRVIGDDVEYSVTLGGKEYTRYGNQYFVRTSNSHNGPAPFWRTHNGRHIQAAIDEAIKAFEAAHAEALEINELVSLGCDAPCFMLHLIIKRQAGGYAVGVTDIPPRVTYNPLAASFWEVMPDLSGRPKDERETRSKMRQFMRDGDSIISIGDAIAETMRFALGANWIEVVRRWEMGE